MSAPTRLYAWRRTSEGKPARVGTLTQQAGAYAVEDGSPALAEALARLQASPYLPLTSRQEVRGQRLVSCKRLVPGEDDYWRALSEALLRALGVELSDLGGDWLD